jgi:AcrR family transcriptional regulator
MRNKDEIKRKKIFESALRIIAEEGLIGLNMQRLALQAEMATGTLYLYFKDKSSLLAQMHNYCF